MIHINIEKSVDDKLDVVDFLEEVVLSVRDGIISGEGWELSGEIEKDGSDELD